MEQNAFQQAVIAAARQLGLADYELYFQFADGVSVDIFGKDEIKGFSSATEGGVCFRCIVDGKMGYASTQLLTPEAAEDIVRRAVDNARTLEKDDPAFLGAGGQSYPDCPDCTETMPDSAALIRKTLEMQQALYVAHPSVVDGTESEASASHSSIRIWNSRGLDLSYDRTVTMLIAQPVVEEAGEKDNDYDIAVGIAQTDVAEFACKTVEKTRAKLGAGVPETGAWPVVFSAGAMSDLLATFCGAFSAEMAQKGADMDTIAARVQTLSGKMRQHFMVDDLKFLRKGGRLSGAAALAGTLLQIKPILQGDPEGKIVVLCKERGRKKATDKLVQLYEEMVEDKAAPVGISHAAAPAEALHLATALRQAGCTGEILSVCHEPVTGAHVGPGMLAVYFYGQSWR